MILPDAPVTFTPDQIAQLNRQLSQMRHDINNALALVMAAVEMMRLKPELAERMTATLLSQPQRITDLVQQFSVEWETLAGIRRE
jgi:isopentenyl diphosphate isomerase/L-lactate dehydrogenase-like FMN-dependent dehydrogenase